MRTEAYVNRLISATKEKNPDVRKIARMIELTLSKVTATPAGGEALALVQAKMFRDALKHSPLLNPESDEVYRAAETREYRTERVPKRMLPQIEAKRKKRTFRFEQ